MFKDTELDFTYPKKINNSTLEGEFLKDFPNIKYKKVCIFMGANASGKTSLGRMLCGINNYLTGSPIKDAPSKICQKNKNASFEVIYVTPETKQIHKLTAEFNTEGLISEEYKVCKLKKTYSLIRTLSDIDNADAALTFNRQDNHKIENPGFNSVAHTLGYDLCPHYSWHYMFTEFNASTELKKSIDTKLLKEMLCTFDSSITDVTKIQESHNSYVITFSNEDSVILEDGNISHHERLSRGTLESIEVAVFIDSLINREDGIFFLDEKMAYSHAEMEIAILNLMIEKLKEDSQLFYTSHNYDVLEMNLPSHSYTFMRKNPFVTISHPEKMGYTKNDRQLLGYVKNDVFNTLPDTSKIEALL